MALEKRELDLIYAASKRYIDERLIALLETNRDYELTGELTGFERMFLKNTDGGVPLDVSIFRIFLRWFAAQHFVKWEDFAPFKEEMEQFKADTEEWKAMMEKCCDDVREALEELGKEIPDPHPNVLSFSISAGGANGTTISKTFGEGENVNLGTLPYNLDSSSNEIILAKTGGEEEVRLYRGATLVSPTPSGGWQEEVMQQGMNYGETITYTLKKTDGTTVAVITYTIQAAEEIASVIIRDLTANQDVTPVGGEQVDYSMDYDYPTVLQANHSYRVTVSFADDAYPSSPSGVSVTNLDEQNITFIIPVNEDTETKDFTFHTNANTGSASDDSIFTFRQAAAVEMLEWKDIEGDTATFVYNTNGTIANVSGLSQTHCETAHGSNDGQLSVERVNE